MKRNNKGFSLVELLAAIVIMGILSGIAVFKYPRTYGKKEFISCSGMRYNGRGNHIFFRISRNTLQEGEILFQASRRR